jgi:hypothetical protein
MRGKSAYFQIVVLWGFKSKNCNVSVQLQVCVAKSGYYQCSVFLLFYMVMYIIKTFIQAEKNIQGFVRYFLESVLSTSKFNG